MSGRAAEESPPLHVLYKSTRFFTAFPGTAGVRPLIRPK